MTRGRIAKFDFSNFELLDSLYEKLQSIPTYKQISEEILNFVGDSNYSPSYSYICRYRKNWLENKGLDSSSIRKTVSEPVNSAETLSSKLNMGNIVNSVNSQSEVEFLEYKIQQLEAENNSLKIENSELKGRLVAYEDCANSFHYSLSQRDQVFESHIEKLLFKFFRADEIERAEPAEKANVLSNSNGSLDETSNSKPAVEISATLAKNYSKFLKEDSSYDEEVYPEHYQIAFQKIVFLFKKNVLEALDCISSYCDNADRADSVGFNSFDASFGNSLAKNHKLTIKQALTAWIMLKKYQSQLLKHSDFDYNSINSFFSPYKDNKHEFLELVQSNSLTEKNFPNGRLRRLFACMTGYDAKINTPRLKLIQRISSEIAKEKLIS